MREESKEFLKDYLNNPSPTGFECQLSSQGIWLDYITPYVKETFIDNYGTAVAVMGNMHSEYKVVIEAHSDEIGWYVNYITNDGYIKVIRNGGSDATIAPSMRVNLWGKKGKVEGIFGHPAIHIQKAEDKKSSVDSIFIDTGCKNKEAVLKKGIEVGTPITLQDGFMELGEDWITGRALDNKVGGFMIAEVARKLTEEGEIELPYRLYIVNSVQEEIGLRGAQMITNTIKPNLVFVTDVCHDTTSPAYDSSKQGLQKSGEGVVLTVSPAVHNNVLDFVRHTLDNNKIKYQMSASSSHTGTDTDAFAFSNGGIPSCLFSLPLKYMHTTVETVHKKDIKNIIKSFVKVLTKIKENQDFKYII